MIGAIKNLFEKLGHELPITSGYRCPKHNAEVGGAAKSYHAKGKAVDLGTTDDDDFARIDELATEAGFGGVGIGRNFVHLDFGPPRKWAYDSRGKPIPRGVT